MLKEDVFVEATHNKTQHVQHFSSDIETFSDTQIFSFWSMKQLESWSLFSSD
jgi:hypothetical protein